MITWTWFLLSVVANPNKSCLTIYQAWIWRTDWNYTINPTWTQSYQVYCDMTTDWWWWTKIYSDKNMWWNNRPFLVDWMWKYYLYTDENSNIPKTAYLALARQTLFPFRFSTSKDLNYVYYLKFTNMSSQTDDLLWRYLIMDWTNATWYSVWMWRWYSTTCYQVASDYNYTWVWCADQWNFDHAWAISYWDMYDWCTNTYWWLREANPWWTSIHWMWAWWWSDCAINYNNRWDTGWNLWTLWIR